MRLTLEQRLRQAWRRARQWVVGGPTPIAVKDRIAIENLGVHDVATVVGRVRCFDEPKLIAPLSGKQCAYYRTKLYEKEDGNVLVESGSQSFYLSDDTGEVLVRVEEPEVTLRMDAHVASGVLAPFDERTNAFLERHGREAQRWWLERDIRFEEGLLEDGETVAVVGRTRRAKGGAARFEGGYRSGSTAMLIEAPPEGALIISDVLPDTTR